MKSKGNSIINQLVLHLIEPLLCLLHFISLRDYNCTRAIYNKREILILLIMIGKNYHEWNYPFLVYFQNYSMWRNNFVAYMMMGLQIQYNYIPSEHLFYSVASETGFLKPVFFTNSNSFRKQNSGWSFSSSFQNKL